MEFEFGFNQASQPTTIFSTHKDKLISDHTRLLFQWICYSTVCQVVCVFGTVTNTLNIICFIKQGFKDPVNITLFGLTISDLGCLVTMMWLNICITPAVQEADLPFDTVDMIYLGAGWPHVIFARVTSFLTAFITLERCLCIAIPLKVGLIFTPRRVSVIVVAFFVILILSVSPIYYIHRFAPVFKAALNKTVLGIIYTENRKDVLHVSLAVNNVIIPFGAFAVIILCTATLVIKLYRKSKWRKSTAMTVANSTNLRTRDQQVSKMVLIISSVFIICFVPSCVNSLAMTLEPRIEMYGQYSNMFIVIFGISFILESLNSSVNIFIYYTMSSKFRATFREIFLLEKQKIKHS